MSYQKADRILPRELLEQVQEYDIYTEDCRA
jgi:hypothetical protein